MTPTFLPGSPLPLSWHGYQLLTTLLPSLLPPSNPGLGDIFFPTQNPRDVIPDGTHSVVFLALIRSPNISHAPAYISWLHPTLHSAGIHV